MENEAQETPGEENSLRDDLEAAISAAEEDATAAIEARCAPEAPTEAQEPQEGEETPTTAQEPSEEVSDTYAEDPSHPDDAQRYPTLTSEKVQQPPAGWRPSAREGFADLPEPVRREIHRRELDIASGLSESSQARDLAERFTKATDPYRAVIAAEGAPGPIEAVEGLMQTASLLANGSPQQKAAKLAQFINHYNVDIALLDETLRANIEGDKAPVDDPVLQAVEQRLAPINQFMEKLNGRIEQEQQQSAQSTEAAVEQFAQTAEFLDDVRLDMADLFDMAASRGRELSMQEAYDAACRMHPEVSRVLARRGEQNNRLNGQDRVNQKLATASASRAPSQVGTGPQGGDPNRDLRGDILAAMEELEGR